MAIGCTSRLFPSFQTMESFHPIPSSSSSARSEIIGGGVGVGAGGVFGGLVICVTGLSKDLALHGSLTFFYSFGGRKFEHALKHGSRKGLLVVTLGWFVDSVRKNVRLSESLYSVKDVQNNDLRVELNRLVRVSDIENSCVPAGLHEDTKQSNITQQAHLRSSGKEFGTSRDLVFSSHSIYVDSEISDDVRRKVIDAATKGGAAIIDHWFVGCGATYVVCEGPSSWRYLGHTDNIATPQWILKTAKENYVQRLVHLSTDLARHASGILESFQNGIGQESDRTDGPQYVQSSMEHPTCTKSRGSLEKRQQIVDLAKIGVRNHRRHHIQTRQTQLRPITPTTLMDSICWSISDSTSAACMYIDKSALEDCRENTSIFFDARDDGRGPEASFENLFRPLRESEKSEKIFKNHFLTILFPIDRFGEIGPSSRTFLSDNGFTCLQLLDYIYKFYQEIMSPDEVSVAIHTDSKPADKLRSVYASNESVESGNVQFRRIDFLGTRRSFEMLKRVNADNKSNVYELLIRA